MWIYKKAELNRSQKVDLFLVGLMIFIGAQANIISLSDLLLIFGLLYSFYFFVKRRCKFDIPFLYLCIVYIFASIYYYYSFGWINFTSTTRMIIKVLYAYFTIKCVSRNFFSIYSRYIYKLSLVSIPLYLLQLMDYQLLKNIVGYLENTFPVLNYRGDWYCNMLIFTMNDQGMYRNSGFAWEPKGFANMVVLGIIFNLIINKFKINKQLLVLLIALATTFSTAGYLVLFVCVPLLIAINISKKYIIIFVISAAAVVPFIFTLDFMLDKIKYELKTGEDALAYQDNEYNQETKSLGRFGSMLVDYQDFKKKPILGYGMQEDERTQGVYTYLVRVNGLSNYLASFGIVGMLFFMFSLIKSSKRIFQIYQARGALTLVVSILMISFGSAITLNPLWLVFILFGMMSFQQTKYSRPF